MQAGWIVLGAGGLLALWAVYCLVTGRAPTGRGGVAYRSGAGAGSALFYWIVTVTLCAAGFGNVGFGIYMLLFPKPAASETPAAAPRTQPRRGPLADR